MLARLLHATACSRHAAPVKRKTPAALFLRAPVAPRTSRLRAMGSTAPLRFSVDVSVDVEGVIQAARDAAAVILAIYEGEASAWETEQKADSSPLTRADRDANTLICGARRAADARAGAARTRAAARLAEATAAQRAWRAWRRTCRS